MTDPLSSFRVKLTVFFLLLALCGGCDIGPDEQGEGDFVSDDDSDDDESDTSPPVISDLYVDASYRRAVIRFNTDEPATAVVWYGRVHTGERVSGSMELSTEHSVTLTSLRSFTSYRYRIEAEDAAGNAASTGELSFATPEWRSAFIAWRHICGTNPGDWSDWFGMLYQEKIPTVEIGLPGIGDMRTFDFDHWFATSSRIASLADFADDAQEAGLSVVGVLGLFEAFYDPSQDGLYARNADGTRLGWLCPANPDVRSIEADLIGHYLDAVDMDGMVLDLVRYHDTYCLCPYHMEHVDGTPGTLEWDEWCSDDMTAFVADLAAMVRGRGKRIEAYVWSYNQRFHEWIWGTELFFFRGQDWARWAREGVVDVIRNMDYEVSPLLWFYLTLQDLIMDGRQVDWAPAFWFSHQESGVDSEEELAFVLSAFRSFHISGYSIFDWTKVVSRPDDFGWAHQALVEANAEPR